MFSSLLPRIHPGFVHLLPPLRTVLLASFRNIIIAISRDIRGSYSFYPETLLMSEKTGKNYKFLASLKMPIWEIFSFPFIFLINTVKMSLVYSSMNFNTGMCNHYYSQDPKHFCHPKGLLDAISL